MFPLAALITNLTSSDADEQRRKEIDRARAEQIVRMREEERKKNELAAVRAQAIGHLKRADQFIKYNKLEDAERELDQAKTIDPDNMYIQAFEERIATLKEQRHHHGNGKGVEIMNTHTTIPRTPSADAKRTAARVLFQEIDQKIAAGNLERAQELLKRAKELDPYNMAINGYQQRLDRLSREIGRQHLHDVREEEARRRAAEEARTKQEEIRHKVEHIREQVGFLITNKAWDAALATVAQGKSFDPQNKELCALEERLQYLREEDKKFRKIEEAKKKAGELSQQQSKHEPQVNSGAFVDAKAMGITQVFDHIEQLIERGSWNEALQEIGRAKRVDPENPGIESFENLVALLSGSDHQDQTDTILQQNVAITEQKKSNGSGPSNGEAPNVPSSMTVDANEMGSDSFHGSLVKASWQRTYAQCLKQVWLDGFESEEERQLLAILRTSLGINDAEHERFEQEAQWQVYLEALVNAWSSGVITPAESERLDTLREKLHISGDIHLKLERKVRHEVISRGPNPRAVLEDLREAFAGFFQKYVLGVEKLNCSVNEKIYHRG